MNKRNILIDSTIFLALITGYLYLLGMIITEIQVGYNRLPISLYSFSSEYFISSSVRYIIGSFFSIGFVGWIVTIIFIYLVYEEQSLVRKLLASLVFVIGSLFSVGIPALQEKSTYLHELYNCLNNNVCAKDEILSKITYRENGKVVITEGFYHHTKKGFFIIYTKDKIKVLNTSALISTEISFKEVIDSISKVK